MVRNAPRSQVREYVYQAIALMLRGMPPEDIAAEIVARATHDGYVGVRRKATGATGVIFPTGEGIDWDGVVWAYQPHVSGQED
jgi:hypothetical protein